MLEETIDVINEIENDMMEVIREDENLNRNYKLLKSIVGIGSISLVTLNS
jgi:hypothetical protein